MSTLSNPSSSQAAPAWASADASRWRNDHVALFRFHDATRTAKTVGHGQSVQSQPRCRARTCRYASSNRTSTSSFGVDIRCAPSAGPAGDRGTCRTNVIELGCSRLQARDPRTAEQGAIGAATEYAQAGGYPWAFRAHVGAAMGALTIVVAVAWVRGATAIPGFTSAGWRRRKGARLRRGCDLGPTPRFRCLRPMPGSLLGHAWPEPYVQAFVVVRRRLCDRPPAETD